MRLQSRLPFVLMVVGLLALSPITLAADAPRIVAAWAAGPFEAKVAFDRPLSDEVARLVVGHTITYNDAPSKSKPSTDSTGSLNIAAARLEDGNQTLVLITDPHPKAATYAIDIPLSPKGPSVKASYNLTGVEAVWDEGGDNAAPVWSGWVPSLDLDDVRKLARQSPQHARLLELLSKPGRLSLNTMVVLPKGLVTLTVTSYGPVEATLNGEASKGRFIIGLGAASYQSPPVFKLESAGEPALLSLTVTTGGGPKPPSLKVTAQLGDGPKNPVGPEQLLLTWTPSTPPAPAPLENVPDLTGGDATKGALVFASAEAKCSACHKVRGEGGIIGPDLSALAGRDRLDVYRDISVPSARIHPDYIPYTIALKDGRVVVGTVKAEGADAIRVSDTEAKTTVVPRAQIEEFRPSATSIMPVGLAGAIGEEKLRDLIAFLTRPAPAPK